MSALREVYDRGREVMKDPYAALTVGVGSVIVGALPNDPISVYPTDPLWKKIGLGGPSAFSPDEVFGDPVIDTAFQAGYSALSVGLVRNTTSRRETLYTAVGAQGLACAINAVVEWSGALNKTEAAKKDVGFSAIFAALTNKFLLDKWFEAKANGETAKSRRYLGALAVLDTGLTSGAYLVEKGQGGALVLAAHAAGIAVGAAAHWSGKFREKVKQEHTETRFAALAAKTHYRRGRGHQRK